MNVVLFILSLLPTLAAAGAAADSSEIGRSWDVVGVEGMEEVDAVSETAARDTVLSQLRNSGHYFARIDSVVTGDASRSIIYVTPDRRYFVHAIDIQGAEVVNPQTLVDQMDTRVGEALNPELLEQDVQFVLAHYADAGHPLASVEIASVELSEDVPGGLRVRLEIEEGVAPVLRRIEAEGDARTRAGYLARMSGLQTGRPLQKYRPEEVIERLRATGFYRSIGEPHLRVLPDSSAILIVPLEENPPGSFDLVLGFLPPSGPNEALGIVGNGHLELNNLFGGGRIVALRLNRLPRQTSTVSVRAADPYVLGLPFGIEAQFDGLQQDSAYTKQRYNLEVGVQFALGMRGFVSVGREFTRPGVGAGNAVQRSDAWFAGVGVQVRRVDFPMNPTRGHALELVAESGKRNRTGLPAGENPDPRASASVDQERVRFSGRLYRPLFSRGVFAIGIDAASVLRGVSDQSDLLRFGGATTLRGYDEDRFLARTAGRALVELRYLLDRESFAFAFMDAGYVDSPSVAGVEAVRGFYPGYGIGMRFSTGVGLVSASYALSSEAGPTNGRIHVGLSFGL